MLMHVHQRWWGAGTGAVSSREKKFLPFDEAVRYARSLDLKTPSEWQSWCKSGEYTFHNIARVMLFQNGANNRG